VLYFKCSFYALRKSREIGDRYRCSGSFERASKWCNREVSRRDKRRLILLLWSAFSFCCTFQSVLGALTLAGSYRIPEVTLYFNSILFRGNRVSKTSNNALAAFSSPNMPPLAYVGINIDVSWELVQRPKEVKPLRAHDKMCADVNVLRLFPGLTTSTVKSFMASPIKGVILESYGAGNAPSRQDLLDTFKEASERGVVIVNITQCLQVSWFIGRCFLFLQLTKASPSIFLKGEVSAIYAVGKKLESVGVVAGSDLTPEVSRNPPFSLKRETSRSLISIFSLLSKHIVCFNEAILPSRQAWVDANRGSQAHG